MQKVGCSLLARISKNALTQALVVFQIACAQTFMVDMTGNRDCQRGLEVADEVMQANAADSFKVYHTDSIKQWCKNDNAAACLLSNGNIMIGDDFLDSVCSICYHEAIHYLLFKQTGDYDYNHESANFIYTCEL